MGVRARALWVAVEAVKSRIPKQRAGLDKGLPRAFPSFVSVVGHTRRQTGLTGLTELTGFPPWVLTGLTSRF